MNFLIFIFPRLCRHPARYLAVQKEDTETPSPDYPRDYIHVTHHLFCQRCSEHIDITHARPLRTLDQEFVRPRAARP